MTQPRMRPVFTRPLPKPPATFWPALAAALARPDSRCRGLTFAGGAIVRLKDGDQRVWSPALHLFVDGTAEGPWTLRGRFSPSSPVWTAFVAIYIGLAFLGLGAGSWGGAQLILGEAPWAFLGLPTAIALAGFTYGAAFIGQGLGAADMYELRSFVDHLADDAG